MSDFPQTDIQKKRAALWAEHYKRGMSLDEVFALNEKIRRAYPTTDEERQEKAKHWESLPEFIL